MHEFECQGDDVLVEELGLVEADDVDFVDLAGGEEVFAEAVAGWRNYRGVMGLRAVAGDGGAVVAEVDVGLEAADSLAGDAGSLEAANELLGFAGEHGAGDDFEAAGGGCGHVRRALFGWSFGYPKRLGRWIIWSNFLVWWKGVFAGGFAKSAAQMWWFCGH